MRKAFSILLLLCFAFSVAAFAQGEEDSVISRRMKFVYDDSLGRNSVMFQSNAPLETIIGMTNELYGFVEVDLDSLTDNPMARFEVVLGSLTTGIEDRDTEMFSEEYLAVDSFPVATFELMTIRKAADIVLVNEGALDIVGRGTFTLHGVMDTVNVNVKLTYFEQNEVTETRLPGNILKMNANFSIRLSDFGIMLPETVILKLDDRISISIDAYGGTGVVPIDRTAAEIMPEEEMMEGEDTATPAEEVEG